MENTQKKANLTILAQSDGWAQVCAAIDDNVRRLDALINDDNAGCEEHDRPVYTARVLNIKQKKMLMKLKDLPRVLVENMTDSFVPSDAIDLKKILED